MPKTRLVILGATGSIGSSALDVVRSQMHSFDVVGMSCNHSLPELEQLGQEFNCSRLWALGTRSGDERAMLDFLRVEAVDAVLVAISGSASLVPTLAAMQASRRILLASKEVMVMAGDLVDQEAQRLGVDIIPIDSEHNAVLQCWSQALARDRDDAVEQITLTASGGPFWQTPLEQLPAITRAQACAHPQWSMGAKISIDSATMMNKALEVIEAARLFHLEPESIKVLIHPQAIVHALVRYQDGAEVAQLGRPDMRTAIAYALAYPERMALPTPRLDLAQLQKLEFYQVDNLRFPALELGYQALRSAQSYAVALNAANEVAVAAFLDHTIKFTDIVPLVASALDQIAPTSCPDLETILDVDQRARQICSQQLQRIETVAKRHLFAPSVVRKCSFTIE